MKNKKIIKSFETIVPTEFQKEKMLTTILAKRKAPSWHQSWYGQALSIAMLVILVCVIAIPKENTSLKQARNMPPATAAHRAGFMFQYQGNTYTALSQVQKNKEFVGPYLFTIVKGDTELLGASVYEDLISKERVLVLFEGQYQIFQRNVEEEK